MAAVQSSSRINQHRKRPFHREGDQGKSTKSDKQTSLLKEKTMDGVPDGKQGRPSPNVRPLPYSSAAAMNEDQLRVYSHMERCRRCQMDCWLNVENHIESQQQQTPLLSVSEGQETGDDDDPDARNETASPDASGFKPQQQRTAPLPGSKGENTDNVAETDGANHGASPGALEGVPRGKRTFVVRRSVHFTPSTAGDSEDGGHPRRRGPPLRQRSAAKRAALRSQQYY